MPSKDDNEEVARIAAREARADERNKTAAANATLKNRILTRAVNARDKALAEVRATPNKTQIAIGSFSAVASSFGGYKINQYLRKKTAEWGWVNEEGERSMGSILLADGVPVVVGAAAVFLGFFVVKRSAPLAAALIGAGMGVAGGSILSSLLGPD